MAPILLFSYHLAPEVARHIRDMNPTTITLPNELSEAYLALLLHLHDEAEQLAMVGTVACDDIRSTAKEVMTVLRASNKRVEFLTAITAADHYWFSPHFAYGVKELVDEYMQQVVCTLRWAIIDALAQRRGAGGEF